MNDFLKSCLPSSVFLLLAIFLFAQEQVVFRLVYPYKKIIGMSSSFVR